MLKKVSDTLDRILESVFRRISPVFRNEIFRSTSTQKSAIILAILLFICMVFGAAFYMFDQQKGLDREQGFVLDENETVARKIEGINFRDEVDMVLEVDGSAKIEFFLCRQSEYEEWKDGDKDIDELDSVIHFNGTLSKQSLSGTSDGDGTFYAVTVNRDPGTVKMWFSIKTTSAPRYFCSICMLFFIIGAALLILAFMKIEEVRRGPFHYRDPPMQPPEM